MSESDALKAYSSPVAYLSIEQFKREFQEVSDAIEANAPFIREVGSETLIANVFYMFRYAMLCTKHPGFHEEKEWRVIYSPKFERSEYLKDDLQVIRGTPQPIVEIPLKNIPQEGFFGAAIPEILDRIIIGPTEYPLAMYEAFVRLLEERGVTEPHSKVWVSEIPLRHNH